MRYFFKFLVPLLLVITGCSRDEATLEDYLFEREYAPPKEIGFRIVSDSSFVGDSVEIIIPKSYQTKEPHISLILKDTVTGAYENIFGKFKIRNGAIRYGLDYTFENYDNLEIRQLMLWDSQFIVHSDGVLAVRFVSHWSEEDEVFKYVPLGSHADRYLILDLKKMAADGNMHLYPEYLKFVSTYRPSKN
jgi:hypothetical protein